MNLLYMSRKINWVMIWAILTAFLYFLVINRANLGNGTINEQLLSLNYFTKSVLSITNIFHISDIITVLFYILSICFGLKSIIFKKEAHKNGIHKRIFLGYSIFNFIMCIVLLLLPGLIFIIFQ